MSTLTLDTLSSGDAFLAEDNTVITIEGEVYPSSAMPGLLVVEVSAGSLYLDPQMEIARVDVEQVNAKGLVLGDDIIVGATVMVIEDVHILEVQGQVSAILTVRNRVETKLTRVVYGLGDVVDKATVVWSE